MAIERYPHNFHILSLYAKLSFLFKNPQQAHAKIMDKIPSLNIKYAYEKTFFLLYQNIFSAGVSDNEYVKYAEKNFFMWVRLRFLLWNEMRQTMN